MTQAPQTMSEAAPSFRLRHRAFRLLWTVTWTVLCSWTPPMMWRWRRCILIAFGAKLGMPCDIRRNVKVWHPRNLIMAENTMLANRVNCYNVGEVRIGPRSVISQGAYLCAASHDIHHANFSLQIRPITICADCWVASEAFVGPGVTMRDGSVLAARAAAFKDLDAWTVYRGNPATSIKGRHRITTSE